jgi:hypothetical protein
MNGHTQAMPGVMAQSTQTALPKWGFAEWFAISQTALPAILFLPGTQGVRLPIRVAPYAVSLAAFLWYTLTPSAKMRQSRAQSWVFAVMWLLAMMLFHPSTPSLQGGLAHIAVYFAVMAPLFWSPALVRTPEQLRRVMWILLVCAGINSIVGVLQVYDPGRWLPKEFSRVMMGQEMGLGPVTFTGPDGRIMVRPPGLFDTPGAVAGPATYAALLGLVFAVSAAPVWQRAISLVFAGAGLGAIYLSQVRISWAVTVGMMLAYSLTLVKQGKPGRASQFSVLAGGIFIGGFILAVALGGDAIRNRFMTLFASDPLSVYRDARGAHFDEAFGALLIDHPFGQGVGRWGMAAAYFGTFSAGYQALWAEIQLTGWMIDGGILLVLLYSAALVITALGQWRVAMLTTNNRLATCGAVVLAADLGAAAMIFTFTPFVTQMGIQYWFLAGALHGVAIRAGTDGV